MRDLREVVREEPLARRRILRALETGPKSVPELAAELECPPEEAMTWLMGLRKYGYVAEVEGGADGEGYFRYEAVPR